MSFIPCHVFLYQIYIRKCPHTYLNHQDVCSSFKCLVLGTVPIYPPDTIGDILDIQSESRWWWESYIVNVSYSDIFGRSFHCSHL